MQLSVQKYVKTELCRQYIGVGKLILPQFAARLLAALPLWLPLVYQVSIPAVIAGFWLAGCYVLLVFPLRFRAAFSLRQMLGMPDANPADYKKRVLGGMLRILRGVPWALPLIGMLALIYRYVFVLDASKYAEALQKLGAVLLCKAETADQQMAGLILFFLFLAGSVLLFVFGWRRSLAYDFLLDAKADPVSAFAAGQAAQKACGAELLKIMGFNLLTLLPALLIPTAVFCLCSGGSQNAAMAIFLMLSAGVVLEPAAFWLTILLFLLLFVPLIPFRKGCYAAAVNRYVQKR